MREAATTKRSLLILLSLVVISFFVACSKGNDSARPATQIILVRHAEKAEGEGDVPLTEKGNQRAELLAKMLAETNISAIYATEWTRNQMTAQPLSREKALPITTLPVGQDAADHVRRLVKKLQNPTYSGKVVVCIEHSNTIPLICNALGLEGFGEAAKYSQMFLITLCPGEKPSLLVLNYGV